MQKTEDIPVLNINSGKNLREVLHNWKPDLLSGFLVFLISLPLALGVSMASGLPPFTGILTAIVGGIIITFFQGGYLTIKAPAAGLIIITTHCIQELGKGNHYLGYKCTLAVIVVSGVVQVVLSLIRTGVLGDFFPSSAVHGMLAAIGISIVVRQLHMLIGTQETFQDFTETILKFPDSIAHINPEISIIGLISLVVIFLLPLVKNKYIRMIPAPMLAVIIAIPLGHIFDLEHTHKYLFIDGSEYEIGPSFLVSLPSNIIEGFTFPVFDELLSLVSLKYVLMFALVGTLESLVSTKAIDNLDPFRRRSDLNKDLFSIGLGNTICGFLGGLPMISEIVRSSSNVFNGARTRWSNFFNGLFVLIFVVTAPGILHQIPLSALAALLIYVGLRLASPSIFYEMYKVGSLQFGIFLTTILVSLFTNILFGIMAGISINFIVHLLAGVPLRSVFKSRIKVLKNEKDRVYTLQVHDAAVFSNFIGFKSQLDKIPSGYTIIIDFSRVRVIDHTVMEHIHYYGEDYQKQGGMVQIKGMEQLEPWSDHPLSYRVASRNIEKGPVVNPRETDLKVLSKSLGLKFRNSVPGLSSNYPGFSGEGSRIKYEGNIIQGQIEKYHYRISDLSVMGVGDIKAQIFQVTALTISGISPPFPIFSLTKEGLLEKLLDKTFVKDIDFKSHPQFSGLYLLQAEHERETREFFSAALIRFLEQQEIYNIESTGTELVIYKNKSLATPQQIHAMVEFGKNLMSIVPLNNLEIKEH